MTHVAVAAAHPSAAGPHRQGSERARLFEAPGGETLVCSHAHACYVGRELQKAEECLARGQRYQMD